MHLSVTCPQCQSKYQLDPSMRGKRMRCPNTICRAIFEVRDDNDPPVMPEPPAPPKPAEPPPVQEAPPPPPIKLTPPKPKPAPVESDFPDDFPGDDAAPSPPAPVIATEAWQPETPKAPPPVRESVVPASSYTSFDEPTRPRRRAGCIIVVMVLVLGLVAGAGYWRFRTGVESTESEQFQRAEKKYSEREYAGASVELQKLQREYPESAHLKKYRFLGELSDVRQAVYARESPDETVKALDRVLQFTSVYQGDPSLKERSSDLWETLEFLSRQLTNLADTQKAPGFLALAKRSWTEAKKHAAPQGTSQPERERKLQDEWTHVEAALASHFEREHVIAVVKKNTQRANAASVAEAWSLAEKTKRHDDAEVRGLLNDLFKAHREQIRFETPSPETKSAILNDDALETYSVTPMLKLDRLTKVSGAPILALARGVLYALDPAKGDVVWAHRVGVDTHVLPLTVPADAITPELLLVLSSDQRSLSAVVRMTGEALWQTPLSDACVGTPVLVDRQVLAATINGRIDEIEIAEGRLLGSYHVGQPLTLGGVHLTGTSLVYFPGDEFCVYEIDVKERKCRTVLYTRHQAGALRGLPTVVVEEKGGSLLWCEARGRGQTQLKPYALPLAGYDAKAGEPMLDLPGLSSRPWHDAHRLAIVSETGMLSLWGTRAKGTRDPLLFRMLASDFPLDASKEPGRCEVVHADAENLWTLTRGRLQRVELGFHPTKGPDATGRWTDPITLGTLLSAQAATEPDGRPILYLTTQADDHSTCRLSAIDALAGKVLWQRQLGVIPEAAPRRIGDTIVLAGPEGLLRFPVDAQKATKPFASAGAWLLETPWTDAKRWLLTNDTSIVRLSMPKSGSKLHVEVGAVAGNDAVRTFDASRAVRIHGTPALGNGFVLLPLENGILARMNLADGAINDGPDWRGKGAEEQNPGQVVLLNDAEFLLTDGSRGVHRIVSTDGKTYDKQASAQLSHRIVAAPFLVPAEGNAKPRLCTLDASETVTLMDADRLTVLKRWTMPGKVTAGPFVRGGQIGCVVGKNRLVWLDPEKKEPSWEYAFVADVVGEPAMIEGALVVADIAGQFLALDPATGRPMGAGLTLRANVAATAAPIAFGPGRAFVPLTDGTLVIVPLEKLR